MFWSCRWTSWKCVVHCHRICYCYTQQVYNRTFAKLVNIQLLSCQFGCTPLHRAASTGNAELCEFLIEEGAEVDAVDRTGQTPLMHAVVCENQGVIFLASILSLCMVYIIHNLLMHMPLYASAKRFRGFLEWICSGNIDIFMLLLMWWCVALQTVTWMLV